MRHFPIFVELRNQTVIVSGAGEVAVAKLRLLLKTEAHIIVFGTQPHDDVRGWAEAGRLTLIERPVAPGDVDGARLLYGANDQQALDAEAVRLGKAAGALINVVDNLNASEFITAAMIDRDPVTVAIGTQGTAPVLARQIKAKIEAILPGDIGELASIATGFRKTVEQTLPPGRMRREFWSRYFGGEGSSALESGGAAGAQDFLERTLAGDAKKANKSGHVWLVGAGPGDPELLTLKARNRLHEADIVLYDRLTDPRILELARREAILIETGKSAGKPGWSQDAINAAMIEHARNGHQVVRLKSGDPLIFGRADEEMDALENADVKFDVIPGITSAIAAAAQAKISLTRRGRNSDIRFMTAHDTDGYAEQDWRALASGNTAAAVYMGVKAARFLQGRMILHGADPAMPVTIVEKISRPDEKRVDSTLSDFVVAMADEGIEGPAILLVGLAARDAEIVDLHPDTAAAVWAF